MQLEKVSGYFLQTPFDLFSFIEEKVGYYAFFSLMSNQLRP